MTLDSICKSCRYSESRPKITRDVYNTQLIMNPYKQSNFRAYYCRKYGCVMIEHLWCDGYKEKM